MNAGSTEPRRHKADAPAGPSLNEVQRRVYSAGWRPADLARHFKMTFAAIDRAVKGKSRPAMLQIRIAILLGIDARELWGDWLAPEADAMLTESGHEAGVTQGQRQVMAQG